MLLGNLREEKGKLWCMGRQRTSLTGKSQKNMVMTPTFPSPHNFMFCHFPKTFHHYLLSKKKASPRQLWKKKQEQSLFPPPSCSLCHNCTNNLKRFSHHFLDCCCQESLSSAITLHLASLCRPYFPISEPRCLHT